MSLKTIGSLLLPHRQQIAITEARGQTTNASAELATGRVADVRSHLRGNLTPLARLETQIVRLDSHQRLLNSQALRLDTAQLALNRVLETGQSFVATAQTKAGPDIAAISPFDISAIARTALEDTIAALSVSAAGQRVFGGIISDLPPLATAAEMLAALPPTLSGLTEPADIATAVLAFFETPGGAFDSLMYRGGAPASMLALSDGQSAPAAPTAADPAFRRQLAALALAAVAADPTLGLTPQTSRQLVDQSIELARGNTGAIAVLQGRVGQGQASLARAQENALIDRDAAITARNALIGSDPFAAANRLEQGRVQLESLYAVTARLSGLSLVRFLS